MVILGLNMEATNKSSLLVRLLSGFDGLVRVLVAHKIKAFLIVAISIYAFFTLGIRLSIYDLCRGSESSYKSSKCKNIYLTREVRLQRSSSGKGVQLKSFRAPFSFLSEGVKDFLKVRQSVQELELPLKIEGVDYAVWLTLKFPGSIEGTKKVIEQYRDESNYSVVKEAFGLRYYKRISSPGSFYYLVPAGGYKYPIYYRCGQNDINCSAFTSLDGFKITYSFPQNELRNRLKIQNDIIALLSNFELGR